jgi:hypothetical protein
MIMAAGGMWKRTLEDLHAHGAHTPCISTARTVNEVVSQGSLMVLLPISSAPCLRLRATDIAVLPPDTR